ncbi:MAG TPA: ABC transporter permease, partial [Lacibacter sp.]|nr:ABC transporter permease [Lacibacter sp.]
MNVASFIARRIVFRRDRSFSGFIIRLSILATAISVAVMIVTLAFVAGFQETIANKVFSFWGHLRLQQQVPSVAGLGEELPSLKNDTVLQAARSQTAVRWVDAFATKSALLKSSESIEGVLLKGVEAGFTPERIRPFLTRGSWLPFDRSGGAAPIVISEHTARLLLLDTGSRAFLYFPDEAGTAPRVRPVQVTGWYKTAIEEYDKTFALVDLRLIQQLNGWSPHQIGGYEVTLH